jgi:hypothetical protein
MSQVGLKRLPDFEGCITDDSNDAMVAKVKPPIPVGKLCRRPNIAGGL